jgi:hypothetical protein
MFRVLLSVFTLGLLLMPVSSSAIPICPAGTMADYLGFGAAGCQFNSLTFSHFSYTDFGGVTLGALGPLVFPPPSGISVAPRSDPTNLGSGGAALHMTPFFGSWEGVNIGFDVAGPGILRNDLAARLHTLADLQIADVILMTVPGGSLSGQASFTGCLEHPSCRDFSSSISFPATPFQTVFIFGGHFDDLDVGFATPEPATRLLVDTGVAGVGLVRWVKIRRARRT